MWQKQKHGKVDYLYFFLEKILSIPQRFQTHLLLFKCCKTINREVTTSQASGPTALC